MEIQGDTAERFIDALKKVAQQREDIWKMEEEMHRKAHTNEQSINVNMGGMGLWIAVCCCAFTTVLCISCIIVGSAMYTRLDEKIDKTQDFLDAIYAEAPQLKPKDK
jgi:hypothetical protein